MAGEDLDKILIDVPDSFVKEFEHKKINESLGGDADGLEINFGEAVGSTKGHKGYSDKEFNVFTRQDTTKGVTVVKVVHLPTGKMISDNIPDSLLNLLYPENPELRANFIATHVEQMKKAIIESLPGGSTSLKVYLSRVADAPWAKEPATEKQIKYILMAVDRGWLSTAGIANAGISSWRAEELSKGEASAIISYLKDNGH